MPISLTKATLLEDSNRGPVWSFALSFARLLKRPTSHDGEWYHRRVVKHGPEDHDWLRSRVLHRAHGRDETWGTCTSCLSAPRTFPASPHFISQFSFVRDPDLSGIPNSRRTISTPCRGARSSARRLCKSWRIARPRKRRRRRRRESESVVVKKGRERHGRASIITCNENSCRLFISTSRETRCRRRRPQSRRLVSHARCRPCRRSWRRWARWGASTGRSTWSTR